jgi:Protein of unknown function (DUF3306)
MTERENFLERWSRKKAQAQREAADAPDPPVALDAPHDPTDVAKPDPAKMPVRHAQSTPQAPKLEFDLASLPSLESITAVTDIRPFLSAGVPQELTRAALRRAWLADPSIRDFVGLAENDWDFTNPAAIPGFGDIPPSTDIKKMIAQIFGEKDQNTEQAAASEGVPTAAAEPQAPAVAPESRPAEIAVATAGDLETGPDARPVSLSALAEAPAEPSQTDFVQRETNIAAQQNAPEPTPADPKRRQHGGALPQT